MVMVVSGLL